MADTGGRNDSSAGNPPHDHRRSTKTDKRAAKVEKRGRRRDKKAADEVDDDLDALFGDNSRDSAPSIQDDEDELRKLFP